MVAFMLISLAVALVGIVGMRFSIRADLLREGMISAHWYDYVLTGLGIGGAVCAIYAIAMLVLEYLP